LLLGVSPSATIKELEAAFAAKESALREK